jgi:hypothetical protein
MSVRSQQVRARRQELHACGTTYHVGCIRVGEPFRTRLGGGRGLVFPWTPIAPPFICKACTMQAQLGTELNKTGAHLSLLMLERMRLIDQANTWSQGTHQNYQTGLAWLQQFEQRFGVSILQPTVLAHPPQHPSIGVLWAQQQYALQAPSSSHSQSEERIQFGTSQSLWSAASQYYLWD